jgi:hypothetical protein
VMSSSQTETRSRGRSTLDRDGTSLEGATDPRARRNLTQGGDRPSSEAEYRPRVTRPTVWWAAGPWVYSYVCF